MKAFYLLLTALLLYPALSFSQFFTIDTLRDESPYNKEFSFVFPVLKSTAKQDVATAINNDLISNVLKIEPGEQKRSLFENIWGKKEMDIPEVSDISFKVINNDADFLSAYQLQNALMSVKTGPDIIHMMGRRVRK